MSGQAVSSRPTVLTRPVRVEVKHSADCLGDPMLQGFWVQDGPARRAVQGKLKNLLAGEAWSQTVAFLVEADTNALLAVGMICLDGHPQRRPWSDRVLRRVGGFPYVNLLARDTRYRDHVLSDGRTRVGAAALWMLIEVAIRDRADRRGVPPAMYGFVTSDNKASLRTFEEACFRRHEVRQEQPVWEQAPKGLLIHTRSHLALVRAAGLALPAGRDPDAYRPLLARPPHPPGPARGGRVRRDRSKARSPRRRRP